MKKIDRMINFSENYQFAYSRGCEDFTGLGNGNSSCGFWGFIEGDGAGNCDNGRGLLDARGH